MSQAVSIIMPAFRAQTTIVTTVQSVLAQTHADWQLWIIADDGADYAALLAAAGIADPRIVHIDSGGIGRGASNARNVAFERLNTPYAAILDADDRFKPNKLALAVAALADHAIVTTALDVMDEAFGHLRYVGQGADQALAPGQHKWVSFSMDSMLVWDRRRVDARYDATMSNMTDLEFLLQLYSHVPGSFHLGTPLHDYVKRSASMSNGANVAAGMMASKATILQRLAADHYHLPADDVAGLTDFLEISLAAEPLYGPALAARPGLLFEDHLEPRLINAKGRPERGRP